MFAGEGDDHFLEKKKFYKEYTQGWLQGSFWIGVNSTGTSSMLPANTELFTAYLAYWMPWGTCMWFGLGVMLNKKSLSHMVFQGNSPWKSKM